LLHFAGLYVLVTFMSFVSPFDRFALTTTALCRAVAACLGRGLMTPAMIMLVWRRVRRAEYLFLALAERVRLGQFRGGWVCKGGGGRGGVRVAAERVPRLPLRFGWLMGVMPYEAAGYAGQMRTVLAEPEMVALVRDVPQARRILGPVCRMLGVELPSVRPVVQAAGAATVAPGAVEGDIVAVAASGRTRIARAQAMADLGRVPLPTGVLAAARRQGYGKLRFGKDG
jgi:hypothetical protein